MDLDTLLANADPLTQTPSRLDDQAVATLTAATVAEAKVTDNASGYQRARRARRARVIVPALAVIAAVPALAAANQLPGVHTGWFPTRHQAGTEMLPGQEVLVFSDPAIMKYVKQQTTVVPLPAGSTWAAFLARWPRPEVEGIAIQGQLRGIAEAAQLYASCRWEVTWLHGDATVRAATAEGIAQIPTWPLYTQYDVGSAPRVRQMVAQVQRGDDQLLREDVTANCTDS